jgi:hypothetical protein
MMRLALAACLVLLPGIISAQEANPYLVKRVLPGCRMMLDLPQRNFTMKDAADLGFCQGAVSTLLAFGPHLERGARFCPPPGTTPGQTINIIVHALDKAPEERDRDFLPFALDILKEAWPCTG